MRKTIFVLGALFISLFSSAQSLNPNTISTDGSIQVMEREGDTLYMAGEFTQVFNKNPYMAVIADSAEYPNSNYFFVDDEVSQIASDGSDGWFVVGEFENINGKMAPGFAHILHDYTIDSLFDPQVDFEYTSNSTLAVGDSYVYISGDLERVDGTELNGVVRLDKENGALDESWIPEVQRAGVIEIGDSLIFLGGEELNLLSQSFGRKYFAAVDKSSAQLVSFPVPDSGVVEMNYNDSILYVSGYFDKQGFPVKNIAIYTGDDSIPTNNFPDFDGTIDRIIPDKEGGWYIAGDFTTMNGEPVSNVLHLLDGNILSNYFYLNTEGGDVKTMAVGEQYLYLGGDFNSIGYQGVSNLARVGRQTGQLDNSWTPHPSGPVNNISIDSNRLYVAGDYSSITVDNSGDGQNASPFLTVFNLNTGNTVPFPSPNSTVNDLDVSPENVTAGGAYDTLGYYTPHLARFIEDSEIPVEQFPFIEAGTSAVIKDGSGGFFVGGLSQSTYSGAMVRHILQDGSIDNDFSDDEIGDQITALNLDGSTLYVGVVESDYTGLSCELYALNAETGERLGFFGDEDNEMLVFNDTINSIESTDETLIVGGDFTREDDDGNQYLIGFNKSTGNNIGLPVPGDEVKDVELDAESLYVGGQFQNVGNLQPNLLFYNDSSQTVQNEVEYGTDGTVRDVIADGEGGVYICGDFNYVNEVYMSNIAHINGDGSLDEDFEMNNLMYASSNCRRMQKAGEYLYVAGDFDLFGEPDGRIVKIEIQNYYSSEPEIDDVIELNELEGTINAFEVDNQAYTSLIIGGEFNIDGMPNTNNLIKVRVSSSTYIEFPSTDSTVNDLDVVEGELYIAGSFNSIGDTAIKNLASINLSDYSITGYGITSISGDLNNVAVDNDSIFVGGSFSALNGFSNNNLAGIDLSDTTFFPVYSGIESGFITDLKVKEGSLFFTGDFTFTGDSVSRHFAKYNFDQESTDNNVSLALNGVVNTLCEDGEKIILGGGFDTYNTFHSPGLYKINLNNDSVKSLVNNFSATIYDVEKRGNSLFIGGNFTEINGALRTGLAELNANNGLLMPLVIDVSGAVKVLKSDSNRLYLGGNFSPGETEEQNYFLSVNLSNGVVDTWKPRFDGKILDLAVAQNGVVAVGDFNYVNSVRRDNLSRIRIDNGSISSFELDSINGPVREVYNRNDSLYVLGEFSSVNGEPRSGIARLSGDSLNLLPLNIMADHTILDIALSGNQLYLGGTFTEVNGEPRKRLASVNLQTGELNPWQPSLDDAVRTIYVTDNNELFVNGDYKYSNYTEFNGLYEMNLENKQVQNKSYFDEVATLQHLLVWGDTLLVAGVFDTIQGNYRSNFAAFDISSTGLLPFELNVEGSVAGLSIYDDILYVNGNFQEVGGVNRDNVAAYDLIDDTLTSLQFDFEEGEYLDPEVKDLSVNEHDVICVGDFEHFNVHNRDGIMAYRLSDKKVLDWGQNISFGGGYNSPEKFDIEIGEEVIYVTGDFDGVNNAARDGLASFSKADASLGILNTTTGEYYHDDFDNLLIEEFNNTLYLVGDFNAINESLQSQAGAIDLYSGAVNDWYPDVYGTYEDLVIQDSTVYISGEFGIDTDNEYGNEGENLVGVSAESAELTFNPDVSNRVYDMDIVDFDFYFGGEFDFVNNFSVSNIAALDGASGDVLDWNPNFSGSVENIEIEENYVFVSGTFYSGEDQSGDGLALVDRNTGLPLYDFAPEVMDYEYVYANVNDMVYYQDQLYVVGDFRGVDGNFNHSNLAIFDFVPPGTLSLEVEAVAASPYNGFEVRCSDANDGSFEFYFSGGVSPYEFQVTGPDGNTLLSSTEPTDEDTLSVSGLPVGTYTVEVTDDQARTETTGVVLNAPSEFNAIATVTAPVEVEGGQNAAIQLVHTGEVEPVFYTLLNPGDNQSGTFPTDTSTIEFSGLDAGTYTFNLTDGNGCNASTEIVIEEFEIDGSQNDEPCDALSLVCEDNFSGSTENATQSLAPVNCEGATASQAKDAWFSFTADGSSNYTLEVSAPGNNVMLEAFSTGDCENLTSVACQNSGNGTMGLIAPQAGQYYIRLYGIDNPVIDEYELSITCEAASFVNMTVSPSLCAGRSFTLQFFNTESGELINSFTGITSGDGLISIATELQGQFDVYFNVSSHLAKRINAVTIDQGSNNLNLEELTGGDIDNSNSINIIDVSALLSSYFTIVGDDDYNLDSDLNCDGQIGQVDLTILIANIYQTGDSSPVAP